MSPIEIDERNYEPSHSYFGYKIHYFDKHKDMISTACGKDLYGWLSPRYITADAERVTCGNCLRACIVREAIK